VVLTSTGFDSRREASTRGNKQFQHTWYGAAAGRRADCSTVVDRKCGGATVTRNTPARGRERGRMGSFTGTVRLQRPRAANECDGSSQDGAGTTTTQDERHEETMSVCGPLSVALERSRPARSPFTGHAEPPSSQRPRSQATMIHPGAHPRSPLICHVTPARHASELTTRCRSQNGYGMSNRQCGGAMMTVPRPSATVPHFSCRSRLWARLR